MLLYHVFFKFYINCHLMKVSAKINELTISPIMIFLEWTTSTLIGEALSLRSELLYYKCWQSSISGDCSLIYWGSYTVHEFLRGTAMKAVGWGGVTAVIVRSWLGSTQWELLFGLFRSN